MLKMQVDISVTRIPITIAISHWTLSVGGERNEYGFATGRLLCSFTNPSFLDALFTGDKRTNSPVLLVEFLHIFLQVFLN